jgi:hypothetical protein
MNQGVKMSFKRGQEVDWTGRSGRKGEHWHGVVMRRVDDKYEILWTRSNSRSNTLWNRDDIPFPPPVNYRTFEPEEKLVLCIGGNGGRHPKTNEWGNRYGMPED